MKVRALVGRILKSSRCSPLTFGSAPRGPTSQPQEPMLSHAHRQSPTGRGDPRTRTHRQRRPTRKRSQRSNRAARHGTLARSAQAAHVAAILLDPSRFVVVARAVDPLRLAAGSAVRPPLAVGQVDCIAVHRGRGRAVTASKIVLHRIVRPQAPSAPLQRKQSRHSCSWLRS
jgi:hypothetical protein